MVEIKAGDRVRVVRPASSYTGCRGTVVEASGPCENGQLPLGYLVAVDGENGVTRPFLAADLQRVKAVCARRDAAESRRVEG
jgi:hypothetical protein